MATVSFTRYHADDPEATSRTNKYIVDGHGMAEVERTNRYIVSPEKHGETPCAAHNCPNDPKAATEYMETLRANYERQHSHRKVMAGESNRKDITHVMFYVSWAEYEDVPADEALQMTQELISRSALRDYSCFYAYHDNTYDPDNVESPGNKHVHISCCPYPLVDNSNKLAITDRLKHDIWREADRICVEHGYSIVHNPVLLADPDYRRWFEGVVERGKTTIWKHYNGNRRRKESKRRYIEAQRKDRDIAKQLQKEAERRTVSSKPEDIFCIPGVPDPMRSGVQLTVSRVDFETKEERSEIQCEIAFHILWAVMAQKKVKGYGDAGKRIAAKIGPGLQNAKEAYRLMSDLDIRTRSELQQHINDVGVDLAELRKDIKRQRTILSQMAPLLGQIEEWESKHTPEAYSALKRLKCASNDEIADAKLRAFRAEARLEKNEQLLKERKAEYSRLCKARTTVERCTSPEAWQEYMNDLASIGAQTIGSRRASYDEINYTMKSIGVMFGMSNEDVDAKVQLALEQPQSAWNEIYDNIREMNRMRQEIYFYNQRKRDELWERIRKQREIANRLIIIGPITLILAIIIKTHLSAEEQKAEDELAQLRFAQLAAKDLRAEMDVIAKETISARKALEKGMESEDLDVRIETVEEYERAMKEVNRHIDRCFFLAAAAGIPYDIPRPDLDKQVQDARFRGEAIRANRNHNKEKDRLF